MTNTIHLCTAADNNYKLPLLTLVNSIIKNTSTNHCMLHVLYDNLSYRYQKKLHKTCSNSNLSLHFVNMKSIICKFSGLNMQHWTNAMFYRIYIPLIFEDLDRMLYIDGDTLILKDISDFYKTKLKENTILAMAYDRFSFNEQNALLNISQYFNSGMILFDLKRCRDFGFSNKCIQWIHTYPKLAIYPDQNAINVICDNKITRVSNIYNKQYAPGDKKISFTTKPFIIHFLSAIKPWMKTSTITYGKLYRQYIPNTLQRIFIGLQQIIYSIKYFMYHTQCKTILDKDYLINKKIFYICNICAYIKYIDKQSIHTFLQNKFGDK